MRSRGFCFTDFDVGRYEDKIWKDEVFKNHKYLILGLERCPSTDRDHIQGYVYYTNPRSFQSVRKLLRPAHVEVARGSPASNQAYCSKDQTVSESGKLPIKGKRSDLEEVHTLAKNQMRFDDLVEEIGYVAFKYEKFYNRIYEYYYSKNTNYLKKKIIIYHGETGTGKTRRVHESHGNDLYVAFDFKWFDGYNQQRAVLFDEFTGHDNLLGWMLRLTDGYHIQVQVKGGTTSWMPEFIYFTTNLCPRTEWFKDSPKSMRDAFFRRVTEIVHVGFIST